MTLDEWVSLAALVNDLWTNADMSERQAMVWYPLLSDLSAYDVQRALYERAGTDSPWPPRSPGEIRAMVATADDDGWEDALGTLYRLVARRGHMEGPPDDLDPRILAYVESCGGWIQLCVRDEGWANDPTTRAQFRDYWKAAGDRAARRSSARAAMDALGMPDDPLPALDIPGEGGPR